MRTKCEGDVSFGGLGLEGVDRGMCIERAARVLWGEMWRRVSSSKWVAMKRVSIDRKVSENYYPIADVWGWTFGFVMSIMLGYLTWWSYSSFESSLIVGSNSFLLFFFLRFLTGVVQLSLLVIGLSDMSRKFNCDADLPGKSNNYNCYIRGIFKVYWLQPLQFSSQLQRSQVNIWTPLCNSCWILQHFCCWLQPVVMNILRSPLRPPGNTCADSKWLFPTYFPVTHHKRHGQATELLW